MGRPRHPSLYQINTRVWLRELSPTATLDDISDDHLDRLAAAGFDWVWFLGVWQTGPAGRQVSRTHPQWQREFQGLLPDLTQADVCGSPFAIQAYTLHRDLGTPDALCRLRKRAHRISWLGRLS